MIPNRNWQKQPGLLLKERENHRKKVGVSSLTAIASKIHQIDLINQRNLKYKLFKSFHLNKFFK